MKKSILDYMYRAFFQAVDHAEMQKSGEAVINQVLPKFQSPLTMHAAFQHRPDAGLAAGSEATVAAGAETSSSDDSAFQAWLGGLHDKGTKAAAQLFYDISTGVHDEDSPDTP